VFAAPRKSKRQLTADAKGYISGTVGYLSSTQMVAFDRQDMTDFLLVFYSILGHSI